MRSTIRPAMLQQCIGWHRGLKNEEDYYRQWTSYKDLLSKDPGGDTNTSPTGITLQAALLFLLPNIQQRFSLLLMTILNAGISLVFFLSKILQHIKENPVKYYIALPSLTPGK